MKKRNLNLDKLNNRKHSFTTSEDSLKNISPFEWGNKVFPEESEGIITKAKKRRQKKT